MTLKKYLSHMGPQHFNLAPLHNALVSGVG